MRDHDDVPAANESPRPEGAPAPAKKKRPAPDAQGAEKKKKKGRKKRSGGSKRERVPGEGAVDRGKKVRHASTD